ncbi:probable lysozyme [Ustilago trichophora]|uniref:N,O-diacetylmuramidase n=1 Tax=Ustilago trichophora TaxID=86804 RepID=A0A5C3E6H6_9BASI|nr:probable lysozyme [Ustilago trichophora]
MKFSTTALVGSLAALASCIQAAPLVKRVSGTPGFDISGYQPNPNYSSAVANGAKFVIIKATEGTTFKSSSFSSQYNGATNAGLMRGAYHFAHPDSSSGSAQAKFFLANGGGWTNDGRSLPGTIDLESVSGSSTCYGLSRSALVSWIQDFGNTYKAATGRYPMIYTSSGWWNQCVASSAFAADYPLWVANYGVSSPKIPTGFTYYSFWQYADSGTYPGDQDTWNGSLDSLKTFARG